MKKLLCITLAFISLTALQSFGSQNLFKTDIQVSKSLSDTNILITQQGANSPLELAYNGLFEAGLQEVACFGWCNGFAKIALVTPEGKTTSNTSRDFIQLTRSEQPGAFHRLDMNLPNYDLANTKPDGTVILKKYFGYSSKKRLIAQVVISPNPLRIVIRGDTARELVSRIQTLARSSNNALIGACSVQKSNLEDSCTVEAR